MSDLDLNQPEIQAAIEAQANKIAEGASRGLLDKNSKRYLLYKINNVN